jgi:hypothetical protein
MLLPTIFEIHLRLPHIPLAVDTIGDEIYDHVTNLAYSDLQLHDVEDRILLPMRAFEIRELSLPLDRFLFSDRQSA